MKCVEVEQNLDSLSNNEASHFERAEIERHLQNCSACRAKAESLEFVGAVLKQKVFVPKSLDARVLAAFEKHQIAQNFAPMAKEKRHFLQRIFIPVPVFALILVLFALSVGAAYQLGKTSATQTIVANKKDSENSNQATETTNQPAQTLIKYVEVPVTKIVEIPIVREKRITRIVYRDKNADRDFLPISLKNPESGEGNQVLTEFNLHGFQAVSELKPVIIKDGKNQ